MSNVNNIHSLLTGKWMLSDSCTDSIFPIIQNLLERGPTYQQKESDPIGCSFHAVQGNIDSDTNTEQQSGQVAVLHIKGGIFKYSYPEAGILGTKKMMDILETWQQDSSIIGVVFDIDSGGGQASGTGEFARFIYNYSKPIVTYTDGMLCSSAYYIASGTKRIIVNQHFDIVGSIGTMFKKLDFDAYHKKMGIQVIEEYATKSTHKNNTSREIKKGNVTPLIEEKIDPINEVFHADVKAYRPQVQEENFNGQEISDANKAIELGLVDSIGDLSDAIQQVYELAQAQEHNKNSNNGNMNKEQSNYNQIAAAIGEDTLKVSSKILTGKKGIFLSESQLNALEQKMEASNSEALKQAQTDAQTNLDKFTQLQGAVSSVEASVTAALGVAGLESGTDVKDSIKLLGDKVKEYGGKEGAAPTEVPSDGERDPIDQNSIVQATDGHNKLYDTV